MTYDDRDPSAVEVPPGAEDDGEGSLSSSGTRRQEPGEEPTRSRPRLNVWQESVLLVVVAVVVALLVKQFLVQAFYIPSESMEPGLVTDDRILVQKPSYWFGGEPQRGDIVVFQDPGGWLTEPEEPGSLLTRGLSAVGLYPSGGHLVKRVIGVGGDTIVCCDRRGRIQVNGQPLDEPYANLGVRHGGRRDGEPCAGPMPGTCRWKAGPVPEGYVFVMGDNRPRSADSTVHLCTARETDCAKNPYVPVDNVVGKVMALAWPLGRAHWTHRPATFADVPDPLPVGGGAR